MHTSLHGLWDSQELSELLKPAIDITSPVFAYKGFGQPLLAPTDMVVLNRLLLVIFNKHLNVSETGEITTGSSNGAFSELKKGQ